MPDQFLFVLTLVAEPQLDPMLGDVTRSVMEQIGYAPPAIEETVANLRLVLQEAAELGRCNCDVQFRAEAGQLLILLSYAGGHEWRVVRALPD